MATAAALCMQGFFYNRYKSPNKSEKLGTETDTNVDQQLWYHIVGTPQKDDKFVFAQPEHPTWFIGAEVTDDGRWASTATHAIIGVLVLLRDSRRPIHSLEFLRPDLLINVGAWNNPRLHP